MKVAFLMAIIVFACGILNAQQEVLDSTYIGKPISKFKGRVNCSKGEMRGLPEDLSYVCVTYRLNVKDSLKIAGVQLSGPLLSIDSSGRIVHISWSKDYFNVKKSYIEKKIGEDLIALTDFLNKHYNVQSVDNGSRDDKYMIDKELSWKKESYVFTLREVMFKRKPRLSLLSFSIRLAD